MRAHIGKVQLVCLQSECKQTLLDSAALQGHFCNILPRVCRDLNLSRMNSYRDRSNIFWKLNHWSAQTSPRTRMLTPTCIFTAHWKGKYLVLNNIRFHNCGLIPVFGLSSMNLRRSRDSYSMWTLIRVFMIHEIFFCLHILFVIIYNHIYIYTHNYWFNKH